MAIEIWETVEAVRPPRIYKILIDYRIYETVDAIIITF